MEEKSRYESETGLHVDLRAAPLARGLGLLNLAWGRIPKSYLSVMESAAEDTPADRL
jgi:hypothetical protein